MKNTYNLYLGKINEVPKDENGKDFDVLYCLETDKEISSDYELNPNLRYFFIILQKTSDDLKVRMENVKVEWKNLSESIIELEHITDDLKEIKREFRKLFLNCGNDTVIFKTQVVGFDQTSEKEHSKARKLLLKVSTKQKWNFWN